MSKTTYYLTTDKADKSAKWQVRVGRYPSKIIKHTAKTAIEAHVWAENKGYVFSVEK